MKYYELFKNVDGKTLVLAGHFNAEEYRMYISAGYKKKPQENVNKLGIRVIG